MMVDRDVVVLFTIDKLTESPQLEYAGATPTLSTVPAPGPSW